MLGSLYGKGKKKKYREIKISNERKMRDKLKNF